MNPFKNRGKVTNADWMQRDGAVLSGVLGHYFDVVAERGEGSWLFDVEGRKYLDLTTGIAVTSVGHCHPRVVAAIEQQARALIHTSIITHGRTKIELAEKITSLVPYIDDAQVFLCNTGAEAVEGALKLARITTARPGVISFLRAFHGRTLGATSITTARGRYRSGYEPLLSGVHVAPYCIDGDVDTALARLDEILTLQAPRPNIGAMIVEPVLGEGGYVVPPVEWLRGLRRRCDDHGILLIFDEVQCGIGRTGSMFAAEAFGIVPDILLFAKGVANGMPLGGIIASKSLMDRWPKGAHGSTFGGNPISCAAALATLDVIASENLMKRADDLGRRLLTQLKTIKSKSIVDVRGKGLMIGIQLTDSAAAERVQKQCFDNGVLIMVCGADENVIRLVPPLNITDDEIGHGMKVLGKALRG